MLDQVHQPPEKDSKTILDNALLEIEKIIVGKPRQIRLAVCCLLASGHCLIEDLPGVGKTTLAHTLAKVFGLDFNRIQFTSDLLPADILGVSIFDPQSQYFEFHPGPIFSQCILADELNRATPKTQSALLEAMEEQQVTVEGSTRHLETPFFVMATQNPQDQAGTFALPESQLDRFMMRLTLGYPDSRSERMILSGESKKLLLEKLPSAINTEQLVAWQSEIKKLHLSDALLDYVQTLVALTRTQKFLYGLSPRAALSLVNAARAWAFMNGRQHVEPSDIQSVFVGVAGHRLIARESTGNSVDQILQTILDKTAIP